MKFVVVDPSTDLIREREDTIPASRVKMGTHFQLTDATTTENMAFCNLLVNYVYQVEKLDNEVMKNIFSFHLRIEWHCIYYQ